MDFPGGSDDKESACNAGDLGSIPGLGRSAGEGMATHSSILAWTEEPGGLWGCKQLDTTERLCTTAFSSVAQWWLTLCDPKNRSTPGLRVYHQLLEFTQTHVH